MVINFSFSYYFKMNLKNTIMIVGSAMLPIIVLVIFFSPYNFDYLFSNSKVEKFRDDDQIDYNNSKCDPKTSHEVDMPVKNIDSH